MKLPAVANQLTRSCPVVASYYDVGAVAYRPVDGQPYSARLEAFNQLDIRFDKTWTFKLWSLGIYVDLQNVYRRDNPEAITYNYNYTKTASISGLPFLPVFGIRGEF